MTKKKSKKQNRLLTGVVFGHKVEDMKESIQKMHDLGVEPIVVTWERYSQDFWGSEKVFVQKTPEFQGMDCINLFAKSVEFMWSIIEDDNRVIGAIANNHTKPTLWNWNLTNEEWKTLLDFNPNQKRYVDELIEERYNQFYGTKDSDIEDISGLTE
jgi:hypothetical protein